MLPPDAPVVLLQHHGLDNLRGKTGLAMLRYRKVPIPAVVDPAHAGANLQAITGLARSAAVVASLREALPLLEAPERAVAVVGLALPGGRCPWRCALTCWRRSMPACLWPVGCTHRLGRIRNWPPG